VNKASPIASILMFVGAAFLLFASFSTGWFTHSSSDNSMAFGLVRNEVCFDGHCQSGTIFSSMGRFGLDFLLIIGTFLFNLTAVIMAIIAGIKLLKPVRSVLAVLVLSFAGAAALFVLVILLKSMSGSGASFGYAFFLFWLGAASAITASVMAMMRPRPAGRPMAMGMRPGMPMPGYGQPQYGNPGHPPQYGAPPAQYGASPQASYAPPGMQQAPMAAPQGAPCPTCQTPTVWVAQYNRWFCQRCNQYP
jgi:hypothetical protein